MTFENYCRKLNSAFLSIKQDNLNNLIHQINSRINTNSTIHLMGNGGSAANCYHINGDYLKTFSLIGKKINIRCYSDNGCYLTAAANDLEFSTVYEILINTQIQENDLIIFFSGSGNSLNLIKACRKANKNKIFTSAITGYDGGELGKIVNNHIHSKVNDMEICEDIQMMIMHYIKQEIVKDISFKDNKLSQMDTSKKYKKRTEMGEIA